MGEGTLRSEFAISLKTQVRGRNKKGSQPAGLVPNDGHRRKKRIGWPYLCKVFTRRIVDRSIGRV